MCIILTILIAIIIYIVLVLILRVFSDKEIKMLPCGEAIYSILMVLKVYK